MPLLTRLHCAPRTGGCRLLRIYAQRAVMAAMAAPTTALVPTADASLDGKGALLYKLESNESGCACKGTSGCGILKEVRVSDVIACIIACIASHSLDY